MNISFWIPSGFVAFLSDYGGLIIILTFLFVVIFLAFRPLVLWYFRINEHRDYQKKQVELETKIAVELEALNQIMRIPLKKASKSLSPATPGSETPGSGDNEAFLEALKKIRSTT